MPGTEKAIKGEKSWKELEQLGIVQKVNPRDPTLWTSALHLQPKSDGSLRACSDFRPLNSKTQLDTYPLPSLRSFTSAIKGAKIFSKLDLYKAFHLIPLSRESSKKTATITPWGTYVYKRLAMGLRNSCQSFQKLCEWVLSGIKNIYIYIDDILVFSESESEHLRTVEEVCKRLSENDLTVSLKKCMFGVSKIEFLGYQLDSEGIVPLPKKLQAIAQFPVPVKPKQCLAFLGCLNYYRRSLPKMHNKTAAEWLQPLYRAATEKTPGVKFVEMWKQRNLDEHFVNAKKLLMLATKLVHPDPNLPICLRTDASKLGLGAVLEMYQEGQWRPLGYWSKHLPENKQQYSTFRRELAAVHLGMRHFREETNGKHVIIYSDHRPLVAAFKNPSSIHDPIATNQMMEVAMFSNDVRFVAGAENQVADLLSRPVGVPLGSDYVVNVEDDENVEPADIDPLPSIAAVSQPLSFQTVSAEELFDSQKACADVENHKKGNHPRTINMQYVEVIPGIHLYCDTSKGRNRPLVPEPHRKKIFELFHMINHPGQGPTIKKVQDRYYWPTLRQDIAKWVNECVDCLVCKSKKTIKPTVSHIPVMPRRFTQLQFDVVGPLVESYGYRYLLTVTDRTSRWIEAYPMVEATSESCLTAFLHEWVPRFGIPCQAVSDNGSTFIAGLWKRLHEELGTIVSYTPPLHPQSLGSLERQHRDLKSGFRTLLHKMGDRHGDQWYRALPWTLLGRRTAYQPELGTSPAELVLGQMPRVPGDLLTNEGQRLTDLLQELRTNAARPPVQTTHHQTITPHLPENAETCTHVYMKIGKPGQLGPLYEGPYEIKRRIGNSCLEVLVGNWTNGKPRLELTHWNNCFPSPITPEVPVQKAKRGRKAKLNANAPAFVPPTSDS